LKHWVIGRGGLLGSSVDKAIPDRGSVYRNSSMFNWNSKSKLWDQIEFAVDEFSKCSGSDNWTIYWCAGTGTVRSSKELFEQEIATVRQMLSCAKRSFGQRISNGTFFFASSIGGMYSGSSHHPIDYQTEPVPTGLYGGQKQRIENLFSAFSSENNCRLLIGRIANLYGPNQNLAKNQGLISSICKAKILQQPVNIYSELDTVRNYIYADDAGRQIVQQIKALDTESIEHIIVRLIASTRNYSISAVLKEIENVFSEPVCYSLRRNPDPNMYPHNLSVRIHKDVTQFEPGSVSLNVGIGNVRRELIHAHQMGRLHDRVIHVKNHYWNKQWHRLEPSYDQS
jgi:UDP-glucose 4-epimerase